MTPAPTPASPPGEEPVRLASPGGVQHRANAAGRRARRLGGAVFAVVASGGALVVFVVMAVVGAARRRWPGTDEAGAAVHLDLTTLRGPAG